MTPPPNVAGTVLMQGGVPIKVGTETIGAIGVSGRDLEPLIKHEELVRHTAEVISHHLL